MSDKNVVYVITNTLNGKRYVGSTISFEKRKKDHLNRLKNGKHHSIKLQNAYNKYGEDKFLFNIVEIVGNIDVLIETEQKWIDKLKPEYNMVLIAGLNSHIGIKRSDETKKKISKALTGKKLSGETKKKISEALTGKKLSDKHKANIKAGNKKSEKFKEAVKNLDRVKKIKETRLKNGGYVVSDEMKGKISETLKRKKLQTAISITVEQYSLEGELIEKYDSLSKAEEANGLKRGRLGYNIVKNKKQIYKGFIWKVK